MTPDRAVRPPLDLDVVSGFSEPPRPWRVEVVAETASTNAEVAVRARDGAEAGLVLVTEHQTAGRGRLDRVWVTPPRAALTFSVLVRPGVADRRWPWLPLLTGLAVVDGVRAAGGPACDLKWPNDVLVEGRKVAGLLAERVDTPHGPSAVLGIGLNVSQAQDELPADTATSLALAGAGPGAPVPDRTRLLLELLAALDARLERWRARGGDPGTSGLAAEYARRCVTLHRAVRVQLPAGEPLEGVAVGVDGDGGLLVEPADGTRGPVAVSAGDVVHVRPVAGPGMP